MPVIRYHGYTEVYGDQPRTDCVVVRNIITIRRKKRGTYLNNQESLAFPVTAPAATVATGWDNADSPLRRKRPTVTIARRPEEQLIQPPYVTPAGWDSADGLPRRRKARKQFDDSQVVIKPAVVAQTFTYLAEVEQPQVKRKNPQRANETELIVRVTAVAVTTVTGWESYDVATGKRRIARRLEDQLLQPQFVTPAGWESVDIDIAGKRKKLPARVSDETFALPAFQALFGWESWDTPLPKHHRSVAAIDADLQFQITVVSQQQPWIDDDSTATYPAKRRRRIAPEVDEAGFVFFAIVTAPQEITGLAGSISIEPRFVGVISTEPCLAGSNKIEQRLTGTVRVN